MIEFFEVMFRALTGLKLTMPNLVTIFVFFPLAMCSPNLQRTLAC